MNIRRANNRLYISRTNDPNMEQMIVLETESEAKLFARAPVLLGLARELVAGDETAHEFNVEEWLWLLAAPARALIAEIEGGED